MYRELVNIQVKCKEQLHLLRHRCVNHWYQHAIRIMTTMKVVQWSDHVQQDMGEKDWFVVTHSCYYKVRILQRIPDEELDDYQNLLHNVHLVE
ncbi:hypothetical protein ACJMK2_039945 [Sinanodonta woodiana]|uniref:Uncharacterized protein n=1 Tax=Sinanodonta woodiana TaxID=1069815 RepID=A0ABD3WDI3_SINWO